MRAVREIVVAEPVVAARVLLAKALCAVGFPWALGAAADPCVASTVSRVTLVQFDRSPVEKSSAKIASLDTRIGSDAELIALSLLAASTASTV